MLGGEKKELDSISVSGNSANSPILLPSGEYTHNSRQTLYIPLTVDHSPFLP